MDGGKDGTDHWAGDVNLGELEGDGAGVTHHAGHYLDQLELQARQMGWLPPSPDGIAMCQDDGLRTMKRRAWRFTKLVRDDCHDLLEQISEQTTWIEAKTAKARSLAGTNDAARRLQTMPRVGPQTALAISAFAPSMDSFKRGRDFAAQLGLVPRQYTSGGKERLGRISKAGETDIRYLLIIGAMSRLTVLARKSIPEGSWLACLLHRKPLMLVAIVLANKMARGS
jgi:transposase